MVEVDDHACDSHVRVTEGNELVGVVLRVGEREHDSVAQRRQLLPAALEEAGEGTVVAVVQQGGRDVPVDEHDALWPVENEREELGLADGRVKHEQVVAAPTGKAALVLSKRRDL